MEQIPIEKILNVVEINAIRNIYSAQKEAGADLKSIKFLNMLRGLTLIRNVYLRTGIKSDRMGYIQ